MDDLRVAGRTRGLVVVRRGSLDEKRRNGRSGAVGGHSGFYWMNLMKFSIHLDDHAAFTHNPSFHPVLTGLLGIESPLDEHETLCGRKRGNRIIFLQQAVFVSMTA